ALAALEDATWDSVESTLHGDVTLGMPAYTAPATQQVSTQDILATGSSQRPDANVASGGRQGSLLWPLVASAAILIATAIFAGPRLWALLSPSARLASTQTNVTPVVRGVTPTEVVFGMSAPFSGPAKDLGRDMKMGID